MAEIYVGIDPGSSDRTGVGIKVGSEINYVSSGYLFEFFLLMESLINTMTADDQLMVVLEDPNLDSTTFRASSKPLNNMVKFRQEMQMAQDVGKNKGVANAIKDYLNSKKLNFVCVAPSQRKQVTNKTCSLAPYTMPTKCSSEQFNSHTGYSGKTNEHGRDAAMLVWDMTSVKFNFFKQRQGKK